MLPNILQSRPISNAMTNNIQVRRYTKITSGFPSIFVMRILIEDATEQLFLPPEATHDSCAVRRPSKWSWDGFQFQTRFSKLEHINFVLHSQLRKLNSESMRPHQLTIDTELGIKRSA